MRRNVGRIVTMALITGACIIAGCGGEGSETSGTPNSNAAGVGEVGGLSHGAQVVTTDGAHGTVAGIDAEGHGTTAELRPGDIASTGNVASTGNIASTGNEANTGLPPMGAIDAGPDPVPVLPGQRVEVIVDGLKDKASLKLFIHRRDDLVTVNMNGPYLFKVSRPAEPSDGINVAVHPRGQLCSVSGPIYAEAPDNTSVFHVRCANRKQFAIASTWRWGLSSYVLDPISGGMTPAPGRELMTKMPLFHPSVVRGTNRGFFLRPALFGATPGPGVPLGAAGTLGTFTIDPNTGALDVPGVRMVDLVNDREVSEYVVDSHGGLAFIEHGDTTGLIHVDRKTGDIIPSVFTGTVNSASGTATPIPCDRTFTHHPGMGARLRKGFSDMRLTADERFAFALTCEPGKQEYRLTAYRVDHTHHPLYGRFFAMRQIEQVDMALDRTFAASFDINPQGTLLFASDAHSPLVHVFRIDRASGQLIAVKGSPFMHHDRASRVKVSRDGKAVYLVHERSSGVTGMSIDEKTGALEVIRGSPFDTAMYPTTIAIDASDSFAYVPYADIGAVVTFAIDPQTKTLTRTGLSGTPRNIHDMVLTED